MPSTDGETFPASPDGFDAIPASWPERGYATVQGTPSNRQLTCLLVGTQPAEDGERIRLKYVAKYGSGAAARTIPAGRLDDGTLVPEVIARLGLSSFNLTNVFEKAEVLDGQDVEKTPWDKRVLDARYPGLNLRFPGEDRRD